MIKPSRRNFLLGAGALLMAPSIVRASSLMPVSVLGEPPLDVQPYEAGDVVTITMSGTWPVEIGDKVTITGCPWFPDDTDCTIVAVQKNQYAILPSGGWTP